MFNLFRKKEDVWIGKVKKDGFELQNAPVNLRDNERVVCAAVKNKPYSFHYASNRLRNDKEFLGKQIFPLSRGCAMIMEYVSDELKKDRDLVKKAVSINPESFKYANFNLRDDKEFVQSLLIINSQKSISMSNYLRFNPVRALEFASRRIRNDKEVVLTLTRNLAHFSLLYASKELRNDREFCLECVSVKKSAFRYVGEKLKEKHGRTYDDFIKNKKMPETGRKGRYKTKLKLDSAKKVIPRRKRPKVSISPRIGNKLLRDHCGGEKSSSLLNFDRNKNREDAIADDWFNDADNDYKDFTRKPIVDEEENYSTRKIVKSPDDDEDLSRKNVKLIGNKRAKSRKVNCYDDKRTQINKLDELNISMQRFFDEWKSSPNSDLSPQKQKQQKMLRKNERNRKAFKTESVIENWQIRFEKANSQVITKIKNMRILKDESAREDEWRGKVDRLRKEKSDMVKKQNMEIRILMSAAKGTSGRADSNKGGKSSFFSNSNQSYLYGMPVGHELTEDDSNNQVLLWAELRKTIIEMKERNVQLAKQIMEVTGNKNQEAEKWQIRFEKANIQLTTKEKNMRKLKVAIASAKRSEDEWRGKVERLRKLVAKFDQVQRVTRILIFERSLVGKTFKDYQKVKVIGGAGLGNDLSGAMSVVVHVKHKGRDLAMKIMLNYSEMSSRTIGKEFIVSEFLHRLPMHPNILRIHHCFVGNVDRADIQGWDQFDERIIKKKTAFFIMPLCEGNLKMKIKLAGNRRPIFNDKGFMSFLKQIVGGLVVLKKYNFIHRDIKHDNFLLNKGKFLICDFGMSLDGREYPDFRIPNIRGTPKGGAPHFMPPEIKNRTDYGLDKFLVFDKYDVFSLGCVCFELFSTRKPYCGAKLGRSECKNGRIQELVEKMLAKYENRYSVEELSLAVK